mgnify:CR=1 FL=1
MTKIKPNPIRNNRIKRDFKRLLTLLAGADLANMDDYAEMEEIAAKYGMYFDDEGIVKEVRR